MPGLICCENASRVSEYDVVRLGISYAHRSFKANRTPVAIELLVPAGYLVNPCQVQCQAINKYYHEPFIKQCEIDIIIPLPS